MSKQECTDRIKILASKRERKVKNYRIASLVGVILVFFAINIMVVQIIYGILNLLTMLVLLILSVIGIILKILSYKALKKINEGVIIK